MSFPCLPSKRRIRQQWIWKSCLGTTTHVESSAARKIWGQSFCIIQVGVHVKRDWKWKCLEKMLRYCRNTPPSCLTLPVQSSLMFWRYFVSSAQESAEGHLQPIKEVVRSANRVSPPGHVFQSVPREEERFCPCTQLSRNPAHKKRSRFLVLIPAALGKSLLEKDAWGRQEQAFPRKDTHTREVMG